eukprot:scaffold35341_cov52-Attheya_sp.AAC.2
MPAAAVSEIASMTIRRTARRGAESWPRSLPVLKMQHNNSISPAGTGVPPVDLAHFEPIGSWSSAKQNESRRTNPFMMTWVPGAARHTIPNITHGQGVYLFDDQGNQYLDWTSQAVCANLGHDLPESIVQAAAQQMRDLPFIYGGIGVPEVRTRLNQLMAELLPGDLRAAVFPSSGAEANEAGIMMARRYTGRHKILSWYRSYHGATGTAGGATGDSRREGASEQERVETALLMLEEQILNEGPETIASFVMESIVGAGGVLVMPEGYMQGVRAICDRYGILMHLDEVMVGFGRTGKLFGFQNYRGVMPDIVSCAKGISSACIPLSMTACNADIMEFFEDKALGWGSTYQAHPVALACAYENIKHLLKEDIIGRVKQLAPLFDANMQRLAENHICIKQYRSIGLFGCLDVHKTCGGNPKLQHHSADEAFERYKQAFFDNGLMGLHRYPHIHCAPPLTITEDELVDGFDRLHRALNTLDDELGY